MKNLTNDALDSLLAELPAKIHSVKLRCAAGLPDDDMLPALENLYSRLQGEWYLRHGQHGLHKAGEPAMA